VVNQRAILQLATEEAKQLGWTTPPGAIFYVPEIGVYGITFFEPGHEHGDVGLGNPSLYFEGKDGASASAKIPGSGSVGYIFMQAQFPLHSAGYSVFPVASWSP
jgi:hypothetical protein